MNILLEPGHWHVWYAVDTKANRVKGRRKLKRMGCISIKYQSQYSLAEDRHNLFVIGMLPKKRRRA